MGYGTRSAIFFAFIGVFTQSSSGEPNFCGMKDPDPEKTCVSLRLPWQEEPIYFCTDKGTFKYRNQCGNHPMHCGSHWSRETLLLATPWDCCPISSIPDNCVNAQCPPAPFNRTCQSIPPPGDNPWECCPKYNCDEVGAGGSNKDCHYKKLEPGCSSPPKDKMNCVGFFDLHGCCTQYQCDGEGKPGMCPMQAGAMKFSGRVMSPVNIQIQPNQTMDMKDSTMVPTTMDSMPTRQKRSVRAHKHMEPPPPHHNGGGFHNSHTKMAPGEASMGMGPGAGAVIGHEKHSYSIAVEPYPVGPLNLQCVGDYNCPGTMKCCSGDMRVYSDGVALTRNTHPTHGFCVEPVMQ
ncbi:unnamed protein product [Allacma fusca]|uniref:WAP domain-containing protein n=1 Tax=Allacma fusca TaxID=39272 RepID=A0A8J2LPW2_9HEXA|nr:unnamed protein product [Allacma fusca]